MTRSSERLSRRDRDVLAFERLTWHSSAHKEAAARDLFDLTPTRYYQLVNALLVHPAVFDAEPALVMRLRRLRDGRAAARLLPNLRR